MTAVLTIHRCSNCGHYEGESPQAGCCPRCGVASDPVPVRVRVLADSKTPLREDEE